MRDDSMGCALVVVGVVIILCIAFSVHPLLGWSIVALGLVVAGGAMLG